MVFGFVECEEVMEVFWKVGLVVEFLFWEVFKFFDCEVVVCVVFVFD